EHTIGRGRCDCAFRLRICRHGLSSRAVV
ncbi:hypothetical protein PF008_g32198, partial [Phytophthora fragariae]